MTMVMRLAGLACALVLFAFLIDLLRRRRLREAQALPWLLFSVLVSFLFLLPDVLLSRFAAGGAFFPLVAAAVLFLLLYSLQASMEINTLKGQVAKLAQRLALSERGGEKGEVSGETARPNTEIP